MLRWNGRLGSPRGITDRCRGPLVQETRRLRHDRLSKLNSSMHTSLQSLNSGIMNCDNLLQYLNRSAAMAARLRVFRSLWGCDTIPSFAAATVYDRLRMLACVGYDGVEASLADMGQCHGEFAPPFRFIFKWKHKAFISYCPCVRAGSSVIHLFHKAPPAFRGAGVGPPCLGPLPGSRSSGGRLLVLLLLLFPPLMPPSRLYT